MNNKEVFQAELTKQYTILFTSDPEYIFSVATTTPEGLAKRMTEAMAKGSCSKDGKGVKNTCKNLKIENTHKAISEFLNS